MKYGQKRSPRLIVRVPMALLPIQPTVIMANSFPSLSLSLSLSFLYVKEMGDWWLRRETGDLLVARLLATAALWARIQKYKIGDISKGVANTL
jgi:hypothetical protein